MCFQSAEHLERVVVCIIQLFARSFRCFAEVRCSGGVCFSDDLTRARFSIHEELGAAILSFTEDGVLLNSAGAFVFTAFQGLARCFVCLFDNLFADFEQLLRLAQVGRHCEAHLIDDIKHAFAIDNEVSTDGQAAGLNDQFLKRIDQFEDFQVCPTRAHDGLLLPVLLAERSADVCWNELGDVVAEAGHLADARRTDEEIFLNRHEIDRFEVRGHFPVH